MSGREHTHHHPSRGGQAWGSVPSAPRTAGGQVPRAEQQRKPGFALFPLGASPGRTRALWGPAGTKPTATHPGPRGQGLSPPGAFLKTHIVFGTGFFRNRKRVQSYSYFENRLKHASDLPDRALAQGLLLLFLQGLGTPPEGLGMAERPSVLPEGEILGPPRARRRDLQ